MVPWAKEMQNVVDGKLMEEVAAAADKSINIHWQREKKAFLFFFTPVKEESLFWWLVIKVCLCWCIFTQDTDAAAFLLPERERPTYGWRRLADRPSSSLIPLLAGTRWCWKLNLSPSSFFFLFFFHLSKCAQPPHTGDQQVNVSPSSSSTSAIHTHTFLCYPLFKHIFLRNLRVSRPQCSAGLRHRCSKLFMNQSIVLHSRELNAWLTQQIPVCLLLWFHCVDFAQQ